MMLGGGDPERTHGDFEAVQRGWAARTEASRRWRRHLYRNSRVLVNVATLLQQREIAPQGRLKALERWAEMETMVRGKEETLNTGENTKSTISIAFSEDGKFLASTHGDHTVKVFACESGALIRSFEGHPRTPWTVSFDSKCSFRFASGCLAYQVRVWDLRDDGICSRMALMEQEVISICFHPRVDAIAFASGKAVYLWRYNEMNSEPLKVGECPKNVRCVRFTPCAEFLIVGSACVNGSPRTFHFVNSRQERTVCLETWKFLPNIEAFLRKSTSPRGERTGIIRKRLSDHAVLYSSGGFDISPDGTMICLISFEGSSNDRRGAYNIEDVGSLSLENRHSPLEQPLFVHTGFQRHVASPSKVRRRFMSRDGGEERAQDDCDEEISGRIARAHRMVNERIFPLRSSSQDSMYKLVVLNLGNKDAPSIRSEHMLGIDRARGVTSIKFSPTCEHIVLAYGIRLRPQLSSFTSSTNSRHRIAVVFHAPLDSDVISPRCVITSLEDDVNIACFHPLVGNGLVYGTRQGKLRRYGRGVR